MFDKAIFGDNQFLGVNHASQAKALKLYSKFEDTDSIISLLGAAYDSGVRDFMFTTHQRYDLVFREIISSNLFPEMSFSPCVPYAHKYWNILSEHGFYGLIKSTFHSSNKICLLSSLTRLLYGNIDGLIKMLLDLETLACKGLKIKGVFIQNLAFDLIIALELFSLIEKFHNVVDSKFNAIPGYITMNHINAVDALCSKIGFNKPWICANYNIAGFRMNPSKNLCEKSFRSGKSYNIAMSVLASGSSGPEEALNYVINGLHSGHVHSILFGSSNPVNISSNIQKIKFNI